MHEKIVRDALDDGRTLSAQALNWIITANKLSDLYQMSPERHFDNAPDRRTICDRWEHGLKLFLDRSIELAIPVNNANDRPRNRKGALQALGAAMHALADFYAHTNWVELQVAQGRFQALAPLLNERCHEHAFPAGLESGYFSLCYGVCGCPKKSGALKPPGGYRYCHEQLAKDHPEKGHGADRISFADVTYHELAVEQATRATRQMWETFHERIQERCPL